MYRRIDLNEVGPRRDELDLLNAAGREGWELVSITMNNVAYLKRFDEIGDQRTAPRPQPTIAEQGSPAQGVKIKYRDPVSEETWTGRGRMAGWLKKKLDAGEDITELSGGTE
jgi:hypothetical protein